MTQPVPTTVSIVLFMNVTIMSLLQ